MKRIFYALIIVFSFSLQSCGEMEIPDPNPGGFDGVDFKINISQNPYTVLQNPGYAALVEEHNVIIARVTDVDWFAVQSKCPKDNEVLKFNMDFNNPANFNFTCAKDGSKYVYDGKGSVSGLKNYNTTFSVTGNTVRVFE